MESLKKLRPQHIGFLILSAFPLYPFFGISLAIAFFSILSIIDLFKGSRTHHKKSFLFLMIQIGFYLILLITAIYHNEFFDSLKYLESSYVLVILPIILFLNQKTITLKERTLYLKIFTLSSFILGVYIFIFSVIFSIKNGMSFDFLYKEVSLTTVHPNYSSLFFLGSILYLIYDYRPATNIQKIISKILVIIFTLFIIGYASRVFLLCLLIIIAHLILVRSRVSKTTIIALLIVIPVLFIYRPFQKKAKELIDVINVGLPDQKFPTSTQIRLGIYHCSIPQLNGNILLGKGITNFEKDLNICYEQFNNFEKINYNTHNYYLFLLGSGGIFALLFLLYLLFFLIRKSIINNDMFSMFIFIFLAITLLTENTFSRILGALFFSYFVLIFVKSNNNKLNFYD